MVPAHHDYYTALVKAGKLSRQRAYQLRHLASGKCRKCAMPRVTKIHCLKHDFTPPPLDQLPVA